MTDRTKAPERIEIGHPLTGEVAEYVRADLYEALQARVAELTSELRVAVGGCCANDGWEHSPISRPVDRGYIFCSACGETMTKAQARRHSSAAAIRAIKEKPNG